VLQRMDNLVPCSGCCKMAVSRIVIRVPQQLMVGTSPSFNGREGMDVPGTVAPVPLQLKVVISLSSNGRELTVVTGIIIHVSKQLVVGIYTCICPLVGESGWVLMGMSYTFRCSWRWQSFRPPMGEWDGCDWDSGTCTSIAEGGHLYVL
jgi:hypothetical protein